MTRVLGKLVAAGAVIALLVAMPSSAAEVTNEYPSGTLDLVVPDKPATGVVFLETDIDVPDAGQVADVDVSLIVEEPADGNLADLDLVLRHGTTEIDLASDNGGLGTDYGTGTCETGTFATFDDEAATGIAAASTPYEGSFKPEQPLSAFDGSDAAGAWTLRITDDLTGGGLATLVCWKLAITFAEADLVVTLTDSPDPVSPNGSVTYAMTVQNKGPSTSKDTVLTLTLPAGAVVDSASASQGDCTGAGPVTCALGDLESGATADATVVATLAAAGTATATATAAGSASDPVEGDNTASASTLVEEGAVEGSETVTVTRAGTGTGSVTSSPGGISCGSDCVGGFAPGTEVTLTATPASGSTFGGWGGACEGQTGECVLTAGGALEVTATFTKTPTSSGGTGGTKNQGAVRQFYRCTIVGTNGDDVLRGTPKRDVICGLRGNDKIYGRAGNDVLIGGPGRDVLYGGKGRDVFFTKDRARDRVFGGPGYDRIRMDFRDRLRSIEDSV